MAFLQGDVTEALRAAIPWLGIEWRGADEFEVGMGGGIRNGPIDGRFPKLRIPVEKADLWRICVEFAPFHPRRLRYPPSYQVSPFVPTMPEDLLREACERLAVWLSEPIEWHREDMVSRMGSRVAVELARQAIPDFRMAIEGFLPSCTFGYSEFLAGRDLCEKDMDLAWAEIASALQLEPYITIPALRSAVYVFGGNGWSPGLILTHVKYAVLRPGKGS